MSDSPTIIEHRINYADAMALAWMLELVAARSRQMDCHDAAGGFEACAATFRQAVAYSLEAIVEMSESTIRNLAATVTAVGERLAEEADLDGGALTAWSLIADELFYREDHGTRLSAFLGACPDPSDLHRYISSVVSVFEKKLDGRAGDRLL